MRFDLERFVRAQEPVYAAVVKELAAGHKASHWMWFVFPQVKGLGLSEKSQFYGISGLDEARAFLDHPILGARLRQCTQLVLECETRSLREIFGYPDDVKFQSSMTLFALASDDPLFQQALDQCCAGERCQRTAALC